MLEKIIPIIIALIALQLLLRIMQKRKGKVVDSQWRTIDYKKRIDTLMKGTESDNISKDIKGIVLIGLEDFRSIPDDRRELRKGIFLIKDALSDSIKAKIGRPVSGNFNNPEEIFDEIIKVIEQHRNFDRKLDK